jgi:NTE family protein
VSVVDLTRRRFLQFLTTLTAAASGLPAARRLAAKQNTPSVGIALGAGGANGLAHVLMLEALDEMGIRPQRIAGSSIGAVIGALYAAGMRARQIRELVLGFFLSPGAQMVERIVSDATRHWAELVELELGSGGLLSSEGLIDFLYGKIGVGQLEELATPLTVTTADLWSREPVVFESGPLIPAVQASMALPGVFAPVMHQGRVLIDGGTVNPVPFDLLGLDCDLVIAIDVVGVRTPPAPAETSYFQTIFNATKVMQQSIVREKRKLAEPDIYIRPEIVDVRALEFYRAEEIFAQAEPAKARLKDELRRALAA